MQRVHLFTPHASSICLPSQIRFPTTSNSTRNGVDLFDYFLILVRPLHLLSIHLELLPNFHTVHLSESGLRVLVPYLQGLLDSLPMVGVLVDSPLESVLEQGTLPTYHSSQSFRFPTVKPCNLLSNAYDPHGIYRTCCGHVCRDLTSSLLATLRLDLL